MSPLGFSTQANFLFSWCFSYSLEIFTMTVSYIITRISKAIKINPRLIFFVQSMPSVFPAGNLRIRLHVFAFPASCWPISSMDSRPLSRFQGFRSSLFHGGAAAAAFCLLLISWLWFSSAPDSIQEAASRSEGGGGAGHFVSHGQNIWCLHQRTGCWMEMKVSQILLHSGTTASVSLPISPSPPITCPYKYLCKI